MELTKFRVTNFRSIEHSGDVEVGKITSLVGRNESGKSNLLLALASLNPPDGRKPLNDVKDFPRSRRIEECKPTTPVVWPWWKLTPRESGELQPILGAKIEQVAIGRGYAPDIWVSISLKPPELDSKKATSTLKRLKPLLEAKWDAVDQALKDNCISSWGGTRKSKSPYRAEALGSCRVTRNDEFPQVARFGRYHAG
jgi:energy-coupling factor transporter ATP-binding protein EcfA2